jgi:hypothetical protein
LNAAETNKKTKWINKRSRIVDALESNAHENQFESMISNLSLLKSDEFSKIKNRLLFLALKSDDIFEFNYLYKDRYVTNFGTDCSWINFRTKETINIWDRCMRKITNEEGKQLIREYNLSQLGI